MPKKRIHINQHRIKANAKDSENRPVITVKVGKNNKYFHDLAICGASRVIYSPEKPLSCGAKVWIETDAVLIGEDSEGTIEAVA